jgi:S-DNA-T family DNA segregation ATPase FtsK/SpoIIIE
MLSETPKSIVRRNRYIISDKTENSENAETRGSSVNVVTDVDPGNTGKTGKAEKTDKTGYSDSEPERDVRSHISKDIDTGNTLFSVEEKDDEPEEENDDQQGKDRVNTDSSMMNAIFGGRKQEHHKKPSLEEYRRRTEKTGSARRNLTKEILEGNPSENSRESDAISLFDTEPDRGARTDIPAPVIAAVPEAAEVKEETKKEEKLPEIKRVYEIPPVDLLAGARGSDNVGVINSEDDPKAQKLISTLESFGVGAKIIGVMRGPAVTRYELQPNPGVKVSRIVALSDDIALNMASTGVRIEAPIPGKEAVGIEVPNSQVEIVSLRQVVESEEFRSSQSSLTVALGRDIAGKNIVADIAKMPHLLIAGATGSGKSVCINTIVASILFKAGPEDVRMIMIDPKIVELGVYNGIPHLLVPVVTNPKKAAGALAWAVSEMENRYTLFSEHNVRDIKAFNVLAQRDKSITKLPQILIIIDELADLMMVAAKEIEDSIIRLSQKARAAGLHIIIATQRPSVDVITGLIKANIPSRIAFAVTSQIDSRTILDGGGAEKLLGRGDMLFHPIGMAKPLRVQGAFVSDSEIEALADNVRNSYGTALYSDEIQSSIDQKDKPQGGGNNASESNDDEQDSDYEMIDAAAQLALEYKQLSTSFLQRKLRLGYSRASRIVDTLESEGLISEADGSKPRQLLMTKEEWEKHIADSRGESV